jgi:hypothetical protein
MSSYCTHTRLRLYVLVLYSYSNPFWYFALAAHHSARHTVDSSSASLAPRSSPSLNSTLHLRAYFRPAHQSLSECSTSSLGFCPPTSPCDGTPSSSAPWDSFGSPSSWCLTSSTSRLVWNIRRDSYVERAAGRGVGATHVLGPDGDFPAVLPGTGDPHAEAVHREGHETRLSAGQRVSLACDDCSSLSPRKGNEKVAFLCGGCK